MKNQNEKLISIPEMIKIHGWKWFLRGVIIALFLMGIMIYVLESGWLNNKYLEMY